MFDYLRCEMPLPADPPPPRIDWWQTKGAPGMPYLRRLVIDGSGRLVRSSAPYSTAAEAEAADEAFADFHGDIEFHAVDRSGCRYSYVARFTEGRCVRIWRSPPEDEGGE